ncbi:MAG: glycosyltransferase [Candidatus Korobacteraceae bacterium]
MAIPSSKAVLSVCHMASGDLWAGAEVQVATLCRALANKSDASVCAIVLNEGRLTNELRAAGIEVLVVPEATLGLMDIFHKCCEFLRTRHIEVLHSHRYKEHLLAAMVARKLAIPFTVRTEHGLPEPFRGWKSLKLGAVLSADRTLTARTASRIVAVTEDIRRQLGGRVPDKKIAVVNNGIDLQGTASKLSNAEAKAKLGISPEAIVIGTAARLEPVKRMDLFVEACRHMLIFRPNAVFVVAGDGSQRAAIESLASELDLGASFRMLGMRGDIADVLRAMDVFVLSSDHEGLPTALLEAMYMGVPVVARAVGGIPEVIGASQTAELVSSADPAAIAEGCLRAMAQDTPERRERARKRVQDHFSDEVMAEKMLSLYRSLGGSR